MVDMLFIRKGRTGKRRSVFGIENADHKVATYSDGTDARNDIIDQLEESFRCSDQPEDSLEMRLGPGELATGLGSVPTSERLATQVGSGGQGPVGLPCRGERSARDLSGLDGSSSDLLDRGES